jgi:hypothetical protein
MTKHRYPLLKILGGSLCLSKNDFPNPVSQLCGVWLKADSDAHFNVVDRRTVNGLAIVHELDSSIELT